MGSKKGYCVVWFRLNVFLPLETPRDAKPVAAVARWRYKRFMAARIEIVVGRIETISVDAVVNAANTHLIPGSGVDGALRHAAGPELTRLTMTMAPIDEGEAVLTPGFKAPARAIIHTAAPIWVLPGDRDTKIARLARCYDNCIALADGERFASMAFPCLGTGAFGWPRQLACGIAVEATRKGLARASALQRLVFCCFSEQDAELYRTAMA